jgi:hypothetical protein
MGSRQIEHANSQDKGLARRSSVAKRADGPAPIHDGMKCVTRGALGGPTQGNPPDASSPLSTDPSRLGKRLVKAPIHEGMKGHAAIITDNGDVVMAEGLVHAGPDHPNNLGRKRQ